MTRISAVALLATFAMAGAVTGQAAAAVSTWTGAGTDDFFINSANWSGGAPGFNDTGQFTGAPTASQPDLNGATRNGVSIDFQSAGWTIRDDAGGGTLRLDGGSLLRSLGSGVNEISANLSSASGSGPNQIVVGSGNTLNLSGGFNINNDRTISGGGTLVFTGANQASLNSRGYSFSDSTTVLANTAVAVGRTTLDNGGVFGGTGSLIGDSFTSGLIVNNGTLAPGGNGDFGPEIESLLLASESASRSIVEFNSGAVLEIQFDALGNHDLLQLDLGSGGFLDINAGATLNLIADGGVPDGSYTIVENIDFSSANQNTDIDGTFTHVNFNGQAIDPSHFTITYNDDSIVVNITGVIPEPASVVLLGLGALFMAGRR